MLKGNSADFIHEDQVTHHKNTYATCKNSCLAVCGSGALFESERKKKPDDVMMMSSGLSQMELEEISNRKPVLLNGGVWSLKDVGIQQEESVH